MKVALQHRSTFPFRPPYSIITSQLLLLGDFQPILLQADSLMIYPKSLEILSLKFLPATIVIFVSRDKISINPYIVANLEPQWSNTTIGDNICTIKIHKSRQMVLVSLLDIVKIFGF